MSVLGIKVGRFLRTPHELVGVRLGKITVHWILEFRDVWVGVYWNKIPSVSNSPLRWEVYIAIVPLLPIRIRGWI